MDKRKRVHKVNQTDLKERIERSRKRRKYVIQYDIMLFQEEEMEETDKTGSDITDSDEE